MRGANGHGLWIVSDGNPGHYNQSLAVAEALQREGFGPVSWIRTGKPVRGVFRPAVAALLNATSRPLPHWLDRIVGSLVEELPAGRPEIIVSSGGKTAFANVLLARRIGAPNVFIGTPPALNPRHFAAVMHTEENWSPPNGLDLEYLPTRLSAEEARRKGAEFRAQFRLGGRRLCAMLIGGDSRSHTFRPRDWHALAGGMNHLAQLFSFAWLVTSSRRTGPEAESILRAGLKPELLADATWWGVEQRPVMVPYLGAAQVVFCTQDSMTMLSEGVTCGKPVYALYPAEIRADALEGNFNARFLARNEVARRIRRVSITETAGIDLDADCAGYFRPLSEDVMKETITRLLALLARSPLSSGVN